MMMMMVVMMVMMMMIIFMMMMMMMLMMMMMKKYDINLTMPPDANTLHAASQEHTQIVTAIVWAGHSSVRLMPSVWQEIVSGGDTNRLQN